MDRTRTRSPFRLLKSQTLYSRVPPSARGYRQVKPRNTHVLVVSGHVVRRLPTHLLTREELDPHHTPFCFIISLLTYFHSLSLFISPHTHKFLLSFPLTEKKKKKLLILHFKRKRKRRRKRKRKRSLVRENTTTILSHTKASAPLLDVSNLHQ